MNSRKKYNNQINISGSKIKNIRIVDYELWGIAKILKVDIKDLIGE